MSRMAELYTEIEEQLQNGAKPDEIAKTLGIPIKMVYEVEDDLMAYSQRDYGGTYDSMD